MQTAGLLLQTTLQSRGVTETWHWHLSSMGWHGSSLSPLHGTVSVPHAHTSAPRMEPLLNGQPHGHARSPVTPTGLGTWCPAGPTGPPATWGPARPTGAPATHTVSCQTHGTCQAAHRLGVGVNHPPHSFIAMYTPLPATLSLK